MSRFGRKWLVYGAIAAIPAIFLLVFLSYIISPAAEVFRPPDEANRVRHPLGFSIIKPNRTKAILRDDSISILPDGGRSRYNIGLSVRRLSQFPDLNRLQRDGFYTATFQNQNAFVYIGPSGKYDSYRLTAERSGIWYELSLLIPAGENTSGKMPPPEWEQYLNTFHADGVD